MRKLTKLPIVGSIPINKVYLIADNQSIEESVICKFSMTNFWTQVEYRWLKKENMYIIKNPYEKYFNKNKGDH